MHRYFWPPCAGVYFEVAGKGYAVHAWASAAGVTQRMRTLMRKINRRAGAELIPSERINKDVKQVDACDDGDAALPRGGADGGDCGDGRMEGQV
jgi:hypothetical protein